MRSPLKQKPSSTFNYRHSEKIWLGGGRLFRKQFMKWMRKINPKGAIIDMTKTKKASGPTLLFFCFTGLISPLTAQPEEKFLYIPPAYRRVVVQKDIEY